MDNTINQQSIIINDYTYISVQSITFRFISLEESSETDYQGFYLESHSFLDLFFQNSHMRSQRIYLESMLTIITFQDIIVSRLFNQKFKLIIDCRAI